MKFFALIIVILLLTCIVNASVLDPVIENVVHRTATKPPGEVPGVWKKKTIWKSRWIKEWRSAKVMKPVWRKIWSPVHINEWVPIPKPPPGWESVSTPLLPVKITSKDNSPMWDPVPYPESQQPPPPQQQDPVYPPCDNGGCVKPEHLGFSHSEISQIIGLERYKKALSHSQNAYPESSTQVPPETNNWRTTRQSLKNFQSLESFADLPEPSPFLVPPKFHGFTSQQIRKPNQSHHSNFQRNLNNQANNVHITQSPLIDIKQKPNNPPKWNPTNQIKSEIHQNKQPIKQTHLQEVKMNTNIQQTGSDNKFMNPDEKFKEKPNFQNNNINNTHIDTDFIQQAQLVGEYHYSEYDGSKTTVDIKKPLPNSQLEETVKSQQNINEAVQHTIKSQQNNRDYQKTVNMQQNTNRGIQKAVKPQQNLNEDFQRTVKKEPMVKTNFQATLDNKTRQIRKDGHRPQQILQNNFHVYDKFSYIPQNPSKTIPNFSQWKVLTKENIPTNNILQYNSTLLQPYKSETHVNHKTTTGAPSPMPYYIHTTTTPNPSINKQFEQFKPVVTTTNHKSLNENSTLVSNQQFPSLNSVYSIFNSSLGVTLKPGTPLDVPKFKPIPSTPDIFEVFSNAENQPAAVQTSKPANLTDNLHKTVTEKTTSLFIVSPSSSDGVSTTESVTKSPVFIVTPVNSGTTSL